MIICNFYYSALWYNGRVYFKHKWFECKSNSYRRQLVPLLIKAYSPCTCTHIEFSHQGFHRDHINPLWLPW